MSEELYTLSSASNWPMSGEELTATNAGSLIRTPLQVTGASGWGDASHGTTWHDEGSYALAEAGNAFFAAIGTAFSPLVEAIRAALSSAWEALLSLAWGDISVKLSKQTRAYYRVKARAQERRKVRVRAHPRRRHRGHGRV